MKKLDKRYLGCYDDYDNFYNDYKEKIKKANKVIRWVNNELVNNTFSLHVKVVKDDNGLHYYDMTKIPLSYMLKFYKIQIKETLKQVR